MTSGKKIHLSEDIRSGVLNALREGNSYKDSALSVGVSSSGEVTARQCFAAVGFHDVVKSSFTKQLKTRGASLDSFASRASDWAHALTAAEDVAKPVKKSRKAAS